MPSFPCVCVMTVVWGKLCSLGMLGYDILHLPLGPWLSVPQRANSEE